MSRPFGLTMSSYSNMGGEVVYPKPRVQAATRFEDEDLARIKDAAQRKKVQNRIAQRAYRKRVKSRMEQLENFRDSMTTAQVPLLRSPPLAPDYQPPQSSANSTSTSPVLNVADLPSHVGTPEDYATNPNIVDREAFLSLDQQQPGYLTAPVTPSLDACLPKTSSWEPSGFLTTGRECGMDMNINFQGVEDTFVHHALESPPPDVVKTYIADVRQQSHVEDGKTALHVAAENGKLSTVQLLLSLRPDLTIQDSLGQTALHYAVFHQQQAIVDELLKHRDCIEAPNWQGQTALHIAAAHSFGGVVVSLLAAGAILEAKDNEGRTPFHLAAANGQDAILQMLFMRGANINAKMKS